MEYKDDKALISDYITAVGNKEFDKLNDIFSEDLQFTGPFMSFNAKVPYLNALNKLGPILERNEIREIISNGPDNCVLYNLIAVHNGGYVPCLEWITIADHKITSVRLLFEKEKFITVRTAALNG